MCLPGMKYTPQQMFWISTSNVFCTKENEESRSSYDEHSPSKLRVNVAFSNIKEFSRDFKCKPGSKMNPAKRCLISR